MLNLNQALKIQSLAIEQAHLKNSAIAVAVSDTHGELIAFAKMNEASLHAAKLAKRKAYTSARDRQTTKSLATWAQATNKDLAYWCDSQFTGIAGGVPIIISGEVVGAVGVSGLSEDDDEALAMTVINTLFT